MGFRPTPEVRQRLEEAAAKSGRSLSQEVQSRLERSLHFGDFLTSISGDRKNSELVGYLLYARSIIHAYATDHEWSVLEEHEAFKVAVVELVNVERPWVRGEYKGFGLVDEESLPPPLDDAQEQQAQALGRDMAWLIVKGPMDDLAEIAAKRGRKSTKAKGT